MVFILLLSCRFLFSQSIDPDLLSYINENGAMNCREQPGGVEAYWSVHTFYPLMPPEEFYEKHSKYYCLIAGREGITHYSEEGEP